jgi:hypothetical protein
MTRTAKAGQVRHLKPVKTDFLQITGVMKRKGISDAKRPMLDAIREILEDNRVYWPLDVRTIHYHLVSHPVLRHASKPDSRYRNDLASYKDTTDLVTRARIAKLIPFECIADDTRAVETWLLNPDVGSFVAGEMHGFLTLYKRDRQQSQPNHIEIVGEKNTLKSSIHQVASERCIPYTLGRGYCSLDPRHQMAERFKASQKDKLIVLVISDFDPEGENIPHSFVRSMRDDFDIPGNRIDGLKVCLTYDQVKERDLPNPFEAKKKSSRYPEFVRKYGNQVHEVEALPVAERARLLAQAIDKVLDMGAYHAEVQAEQQDLGRIEAIRETATKAINRALKRQ